MKRREDGRSLVVGPVQSVRVRVAIQIEQPYSNEVVDSESC